MLLVAARGVERRNTWYLASDQFAFLTFAGDLARGTVFHDDSTLELVVPKPHPRITYDALVQTYFWRAGKLYSRYPPGFPALLAVVGAVGGEWAQHWLNPVLYLTILALVGWLTWELVRPNDRALAAGAAVASMWLLLLLPTDVHLWGITVARDLPAHLLALLSLLAAVRKRHVLCGLALGVACTVRPDAILYGVSLAGVLWLDGLRLRPLLLGGLAFLIGALPLFVYNTVTQGHPFAFTQGGEFRELLGSLLTPTSAFAQGITHGSGGAFQLSNLWETLPGNLRQLGKSFGWLGVVTAIGVVWSVRVRRPLAAALVPYPVVALVFYSCWSHPDARYLAGAALCLIPLTAVGAVVACRWLATEERAWWWRVLAVVAAAYVVGQGWLPPRMRSTGLGTAESALAWAVLASALLPIVPRAGAALQRLAPLAPALAMAVLVLLRIASSAGIRDPFQQAEAERARRELGALVPPGSVVLTSESLGRPAENIAHYVGVDALYLTELALLRTDRDRAALLLVMGGRRTFFLLDEEHGAALDSLRTMGGLRVVARRRGDDVLDWFVDPRRAPRGVVLYELVLPEDQKRLLQQFKGHVEGEL